MQNCYEIEKNQTAALEERKVNQAGDVASPQKWLSTLSVVLTVMGFVHLTDFNSDGICSFAWF